MDLYLIRHTAVAVAGRCYGHTDVPLADTFAAEAAQLRAKLPDGAPGWRVLSSPAARCCRLAENLWPETAIAEDVRLRELHFGAWENRPWADLPPDELNPWMADFVAQAPPGGEAFEHLHERTGALLAELLAAPAAGPVALVTHAGIVRSLLCHALELPLAQAFQVAVDFASVSGLRHQHGRWEVRFVNR
ncbi:alpha-ribazole phosphatase [Hymenobacter glaciei]|uniref:Alpha-ribazole phosphatase n=1 Tax=Hymenobacter glaciei TaxID=877209 RepID=A0ABP7UWS4_9BACT